MNITINNIFTIEDKQEKSVALFAQEELTEYLNQIFSLADKDFILDITLATTNEDLKYDGYSIEINEAVVRIESKTASGILHGVYEFLRMLGCSFIFPGKERQSIPKLEGFKLKNEKIIREPWIEYRGLCLYNTKSETLIETIEAIDWMAKSGYNFLLTSIDRIDDTDQGDHAILWAEIQDQVLPEIRKRGIVIDMSEHSTDHYFPRSKWFLEHPEWFSLQDGERSPEQICYSNNNAVKAYSDSIVDFVKDKPEFKFFGIWPLDGDGYCECENCEDPLTLFNANTYIAKQVEKVRPDLIVEHLAYTPQSFARPETSIPQNMSVLVCHKRDEIAYEWGEKVKDSGGAFYFEYMTADYYRSRSNVQLNPVFIKDTVNAMVAYKYRGIVSLYLPITCWWQSSINYWYMREFYYNPTANIKDLTKCLAKEIFGEKHEQAMTSILEDTYDNLQDKSLWSGNVHSHEWFAEHLSGRNVELDALHCNKMEETYHRIMDQIEKEKVSVIGDREKRQFELFQEYINLQWLYYTGVDLYNADVDTPSRAEDYFKKLRELEKKEDNPFISEKYARWRITGRDNIFAPPGQNKFEAHN